MTKLEYLDQLRSCLGQLPPEEAEKAAIYYGELIDDMTEDGYTEQEAVQTLSPPAQAARQVLEELPLATLVKSRAKPKKGWTPAAIVLAAVGSPIWISIGLALLAVVLSVYIVIGRRAGRIIGAAPKAAVLAAHKPKRSFLAMGTEEFALFRRLFHAFHRRGGIFRLVAPCRFPRGTCAATRIGADGKVRLILGEKRRHFLLAKSRRAAPPIVGRGALSCPRRRRRPKIV